MANHKGLIEPHVLLAAGNPPKLMRNLVGILTPLQINKISTAVDREVALLFALGISHFDFATATPDIEWRQKVSRFYYAAYNVKRSVTLKDEGTFSTESSDHKNVSIVPVTLGNHATHSMNLKNLREDRNLADYSHLAKAKDLVISVADAQQRVSDFITDARVFLVARGVAV